MAVFGSAFLYLLAPRSAGQFEIASQLEEGAAQGDSGDVAISIGEPPRITVPAHPDVSGPFRYLGYDPGVAGYVAEAATGNMYLFANDSFEVRQRLQVQAHDMALCYLPGTMIRCPDAERPVETLAIGDAISTPAGTSVRVKWIGRQTIAPPFGIPEQRCPVSIAADALNDNVPNRELRITADHALLIDGVLVHAEALINGTTIRRIAPSEFGNRLVVYHIETHDHEIVLANAAPAETFIDNVTRAHFDNYAQYEELYSHDDHFMIELDVLRARSARQVPLSIRNRIAERAALLPEAAVA